LYRTVRIWEAARATSAASTFFDPIQIGENGQRFLDGGTVANNPVRQLWGEAVDMIDQQALTNDLNCLISIGTGEPSYKGFDDTVMGIVNTLSSIATETEETANSFHQEQSRLFDKRVCYRYNVPRGMGDIGLAETEQRAAIKSMTDAYLQSELIQSSMRSCVRVLKQRQCTSDFA
jgi:patatin-like phospholipase/acyl hydrolase